MSKEPVRQTAYSDYVYKQIDDYFRSGGWCFTAAEFAELTGLKLTGNLRRRLNHAVAVGKLKVSYFFVGKRSRSMLYIEPSKIGWTGDLPF